MTARGVVFALADEERRRLLAADDLAERLRIVQEEIEEAWDAEHLCELDKAWDAIHRCLTEGPLARRAPALAEALLGGRSLYDGEDYIMVLVDAARVGAVAAALGTVEREELRAAFFALTDYDGPQDEEDFEYTWSNLEDLVDLYARAHRAGRAVLFTVDA